MDIFNVEVLLRDYQCSRVRVQIVESVVAAGPCDSAQVLPAVIQAQAVVVADIGLLQRINCVRLHVLRIGSFREAALRVLKLRIVHVLRVDGCTTSAHLGRLLLANVKRLTALLLLLRCQRAARVVVALVVRDAVVHGALGLVLTVVLEAALGRILRSRAQVHLQVLHDVRLAILEVVGNVGAHHAHLAVTLAVGTSLALIRHQRRLPTNLRPHRLGALPLRKH